MICWACQERDYQEQIRQKWNAEAAAWATEACIRAGMSPREAKADLSKIPAEIKKAVPLDIVRPMLEGHPPAHGFGLGGQGTGAGKTSAMAAILKNFTQAREVVRVAAGGEPPLPLADIGLTWWCWPSRVAAIRANAIVEGYSQAQLNTATEAPILFLDDLGSERIKGSYVEDFAASQLDVIVDERYRQERPIFYTTNLDLEGLLDFYGARLTSRLCGDNPLAIVAGLKDQRFAK